MKDSRNPKLKMRIIEEDLTAWDLITANPKELASEKQKEEREKILEANLQERRSDWLMELQQKSAKGTGFFTCRKCRSKNTTYY